MNIAGSLLSDRKSVANAFNNFFTNIAQNLVNKLSPANSHYKDYLTQPNAASFFLSPVDPSEVHDELGRLNESKAPDAYDVPVKLIKCIGNSFKEPLTDLINESFSSGVYPTMLKYAKVVPVYKGKSQLEVTNYRPISLLPIFNKIFEKLMHARLIKFLDMHKIIFNHQFGFQKNKSTSLAILDVCTQLVNAVENKQFLTCIFLDFAKAFDTVDHNILIYKLEY